LEQMGVRILSTHIGGAPLNLERQLGFSLGTWNSGGIVAGSTIVIPYAHCWVFRNERTVKTGTI
jgi:hypothetical protein